LRSAAMKAVRKDDDRPLNRRAETLRPDGHIHIRQLDGLFIGPSVSCGQAKEEYEGYCFVLYKTQHSPLNKSYGLEWCMRRSAWAGQAANFCTTSG